MPWNTLATKTVGATITKAELQQLVENILFLRKRPSYRIQATADNNAMAVGVWKQLAWDTGSDVRHEDWDDSADIGGNNYNGGVITQAQMASAADELNIGAHRTGIWFTGFAAVISGPDNFDGSFRHRIENSGTVLCEEFSNFPNLLQLRISQCFSTIDTYGALDYVQCAVECTDSNATAVKAAGVGTPPVTWGLWVGDEANDTNGLEIRSVEDATDIVQAWNRAVNDLNRLYRRPAARMEKSGNQVVTGSGSPTTAGTWTTIATWTTAFDNASMVSGNTITSGVIDGGRYYVSAGVALDGYTGTSGSGDRVIARLVRDLGGPNELILDQAVTNCDDHGATGASGGDVCLSMCFLGQLSTDVGDNYTLQVRADGASVTVLGDARTHLSAMLVYANLTQLPATSPIRRRFRYPASGVGLAQEAFERIPDIEAMDVTDLDTNIAPLGLLNALWRDYIFALASPPYLGVEISGPEPLGGGGFGGLFNWQRLPFNFYEFDPWSLFPDESEPNQGIVVPMDGMYLVTARVSVGTVPTEGFGSNGTDGYGDYGERGFRITHNDEVIGEVVTNAMDHDTHRWVRNTSVLVVAKAGDILAADAAQSSDSGLGLAVKATGGIPGDCRLTAVWVGDGYTRDKPAEGNE